MLLLGVGVAVRWADKLVEIMGQRERSPCVPRIGGGPRNAVHGRLDGRNDGRPTVVGGHRVGVTLGQGICAALLGPGERTYAIFPLQYGPR